MSDEWLHCFEAADHWQPIAAAFRIIQIVSTEECSGLTQNLMQSRRSTRSAVVSATPHGTRAHSVAPTAPRLVQGRCQCSHTHVPVPSPWPPGYAEVAQTILIVLTMAGLFPDEPCIFLYIYVCASRST